MGYLVAEGGLSGRQWSFSSASQEVMDDFLRCFYAAYEVRPKVTRRANLSGTVQLSLRSVKSQKRP